MSGNLCSQPTNVIKAGVSPDQGDRGQTDNFQLFSYSVRLNTAKYGYADQKSVPRSADDEGGLCLGQSYSTC